MLSMLHWYHYTMYIAGLLTLFSVAARSMVVNTSLMYVHEMMHNIGCNHNVESAGTTAGYSFGYR
jgi:hypothetical protein